MHPNLILTTDSYKATHWLQYPPGTEFVHSYFESRSGKWDEIVFFGLQYILKRHLVGQVITRELVDEAERFFTKHFQNAGFFNRDGWLYIVEHYDGKLPVEIRAVPEGTVVSSSNVLMTVENTDPACFWLTNYLETILSQVWYPCTVATQSREMKKVIQTFLTTTGRPETINERVIDFGYRGSTSDESAGIGGAAHLVNFKTSETLVAMRVLHDFYGMEEMPGYNIPAAEHSTIMAWGRNGETEAFRHILQNFPTGPISIASDTYDIYNAVTQIWGGQLRDSVLARNGTLIVRPDSGEPVLVTLRVIKLLASAFGFEMNSVGYKVLPAYLRLILGDGIDYENMGRILEALSSDGWSADNVAFGSGGGLLQKVNRDTLGFAFKASQVTVNGTAHNIAKDPLTDPMKRSKSGKLALAKRDGWWTTVQRDELIPADDYLKVVFRNGELLVNQEFPAIRERAAIQDGK